MTAVAPNFVIVTLGVRDVRRSAAFYRALGWEQRGDPADGIVWFRTSGSWIGLFGERDLADEVGTGLPDPRRFRGATYAVNLPSEADVDLAFEAVRALGAEIVKPATRLEWGGYSGYFADPDGHLWELCHNPGFPLDEHGRIDIP